MKRHVNVLWSLQRSTGKRLIDHRPMPSPVRKHVFDSTQYRIYGLSKYGIGQPRKPWVSHSKCSQGWERPLAIVQRSAVPTLDAVLGRHVMVKRYSDWRIKKLVSNVDEGEFDHSVFRSINTLFQLLHPCWRVHFPKPRMYLDSNGYICF